MRCLNQCACWLIAAVLVTQTAVAGFGLVATPNTTVQNGDTVILAVSNTNHNDSVFLAFGSTLGSSTLTFGSAAVTLGLATPFSLLALGNGDVTVPVAIPAVPASLTGMTVHLQAISLGITFGPGGPPQVATCASNLDSLSF